MSKRVKAIIARDLSQRFRGVGQAIFLDFTGLTAEESVAFRASLRGAGCTMNVVKNTITRRVFRESGIELPEDCFSGPTAIVWGEIDALSASKAIANWRKKNRKEITLKGGLLDGEPLTANDAEKLTKMPTVQELKQLLLNAVAGPLVGLVAVTNSILSGLPNVLRAIADKKEGE